MAMAVVGLGCVALVEWVLRMVKVLGGGWEVMVWAVWFGVHHLWLLDIVHSCSQPGPILLLLIIQSAATVSPGLAVFLVMA